MSMVFLLKMLIGTYQNLRPVEVRAHVNVQEEHAYRDCPSRASQLDDLQRCPAEPGLTRREAYMRGDLCIDKPVPF